VWPSRRVPLKLKEALSVAGGYDLDPTVWEIGDPATDRQLAGLAGKPPPKPHPLYAPGHHDTDGSILCHGVRFARDRVRTTYTATIRINTGRMRSAASPV
jgi:hypothetical protein